MNQRTMRPNDDLPLYPTPQQASYVIPGSEQPRKQSAPSSNGKTQYRPPASNGQYSHLQPNLTYGQPTSNQNYNAPTPQQYYQKPPPSQKQPPPPQHPQQQLQQPPQQYQQHYQQPARQQVAQPPSRQQVQQPPPQQQYQQYSQSPPQQKYQQYSQSPPQHQPEQLPVNSFNQMRITPQQPYQSKTRLSPQSSYQQQPQQPLQQPVYQQHSGPGHSLAPQSQHSGPSHALAPQSQHSGPSQHRTTSPPDRLVSGSSSSSLPHKKPPPSEKPKVKLEQELRQVFDKVDKNHSGKISARELSYALTNFDSTKFRDSTIILMIKLFSTSSSSNSLPSKLLNFDQFVSLWKHLASYKKLFIQADVDTSGDISFGEFQKILKEIGYKLNIDLALHLFQKFSYKNLDDFDSGITVGKLKFDSFVELLVYLKKLTDVFKKYDKEKIGVSTIGFSDFLLEVSNLT